MNLQRFFWMIPFFSFIVGYSIFSYLYNPQPFPTPSFVGLTLSNALVIASKYNLNLRFLSDKIDSDLPNNTILNQTPIFQEKIRPHQSVYVVLSKTAPLVIAPSCLKKKKEILTQELTKKNIKYHFYYHPNNYPQDTCFSQSPSSESCLVKNNLIIYLSKNENKPVIFPDVTNKPIQDVINFLNEYKFKINVIHTNDQPKDHICSENCIVTNQRPLAGSIITFNKQKSPLIQLQIN